MNSVVQLRGLLAPKEVQQTGEVISYANGLYMIALPTGAVRVPLSNAYYGGVEIGSWVAVLNGAIVGKAKPLTQVPTYYV